MYKCKSSTCTFVAACNMYTVNYAIHEMMTCSNEGKSIRCSDVLSLTMFWLQCVQYTTCVSQGTHIEIAIVFGTVFSPCIRKCSSYSSYMLCTGKDTSQSQLRLSHVTNAMSCICCKYTSGFECWLVSQHVRMSYVYKIHSAAKFFFKHFIYKEQYIQ